MKNFSLKALGASLLTFGLFFVGISAASASPSVAVANGTTLPTFQATVATPAFSITIDNQAPFASELTEISISNGSSWFIRNSCATSGTPYATSGCGITSITKDAGAGLVTFAPMAFQNPSVFGGLKITGLGDATKITISFAAGAWNPSANSGSYTLKVTTGGVDSTMALTLAPAPPPTTYTVTFNANGGDGGTMSDMVASGMQSLRANAFTKTGTSFSGWSRTCGAAVSFANRAMYSFTADQTLWAVWADGSSTCGGAGSAGAASANLTLNAATGQLVAGSTVAVAATGLQSTAAYTVVVQSTPQTIGSGNAVSGAVNTSVTLPSGLEAGWHTLTFTSTAADGSTVTSVSYFKISASGTLLETTTTTPAELASTGFDAAPYLSTGAVLALAGAVLILFARRRQTS